MSSDHAPRIERTTVLALASDEPDPAGVRGRLDRLAAVRAPALSPLTRVADVPGGIMLTHLVPLGAVSLEELRHDGPLRAGHVLAVALAVTEAMAALHEAGLAHGGIETGQVLVALDGDVVLAGTGLAWGAGAMPRPADDVAAIGDLVRDLLGSGSSSAPLVMAALRAADADPELRPYAADLLAALRRCGRPESLLDALWPGPGDADPLPVPVPQPTGAGPDVTGPIRLAVRDASPAMLRPRPAGSASRPTPSRGRRTTAGRPMVVALVVSSVAASAVVLAAVRPASSPVGERLEAAAPTASAAATESSAMPSRSPAEQPRTSASPSATPAAPQPTPAVAQWVATLAEIDLGRQAALGTGSVEMLRRWVDPASPAWVDDAALARRVTRAHARIEGGDLVVEEVRVGDVDDISAVLQVRDVRRAYVVVTPGGRSSVPERAARWWTITLRAGGTGWRLAQVEPGAEPVSLSTRRVPR